MMKRVWLCPIRLKSWVIIKKAKVYGLPVGKKKHLDDLNIDDLIFIYVYPPKARVVGLCKIVSKPYFGYDNHWGKSITGSIKYPYRINLEILNNFEKNDITLAKTIGYSNKTGSFTIEPYLKGVLFLELPQLVAQDMLSIISNHSSGITRAAN